MTYACRKVRHSVSMAEIVNGERLKGSRANGYIFNLACLTVR
jgi:hypothetical protein